MIQSVEISLVNEKIFNSKYSPCHGNPSKMDKPPQKLILCQVNWTSCKKLALNYVLSQNWLVKKD